MSIQKDLVILGAGTIGTPLILLRSRLYGLTTSSLVGQRLSGNGDKLNFAYNCNQDVRSIGQELNSYCGPTITGCIDLRGVAHTSDKVRDGFIIQDGAIPEALSPVIQTLLETHRSGSSPKSYNHIWGTLARLRSWILGPYIKNGSVRRTMVFLTMSHDENQGTITIENDQAAVRWEGASEAGGYKSRVLTTLKTMTDHMGGIFVKSPAMTVHPLGGAVMSADASGSGGVVSHRGELFSEHGGAVHKGIFCVDGSVVPTSLGELLPWIGSLHRYMMTNSMKGVNPCATITALAERTCDLIICERKYGFDQRPNGELDVFSDPPFAQARQDSDDSLGNMPNVQSDIVRFLETMEGYVYIGANVTEFRTAETAAKAASSTAELTLRVTVHRESSSSYHGAAHGTFSCGALSPDPLLVINGSVSFFTVNKDVADARHLVYYLELMSTQGKTYILRGYKHIDSSITLSISRTWRATTTLYTTITDSTGTLVGRGILRLSLPAFVSELQSMYSLSKMWPCFMFLSFFAQNIASYFFTPFRPLQQPTPATDSSGYFEKPTPKLVTLTADDGVTFPLKIWQPPSTAVSKHTPLLLMPGASVDEQIFSLPTLPINTVDYFTSLGYTCYVPVLRFGAGQNARYGYTAFDARLDVRAAVKYVYEQEARKVYIVAHCLGSIATAMALLTGEIDARSIAGMTVSQVFTHTILSPDNVFKAQKPWLIKLYRVSYISAIMHPTIVPELTVKQTLSSSPWFPISTTSRLRFIDTLLRFYPVGSRHELCRSAVCHRCDIPFGRCWTHANLNHATHRYLDRFFDGIHTHFLEHLSGMGAISPSTVRTNFPEFQNLVTSENLERLNGIKIAFLHGGENAVWSSRATKASYDTLREVFPLGEYARIVVVGYGHLDCWMARNAYKDVWPSVFRHVELCEEAEDGYIVVGPKHGYARCSDGPDMSL
jgi:hypothetical protein